MGSWRSDMWIVLIVYVLASLLWGLGLATERDFSRLPFLTKAFMVFVWPIAILLAIFSREE
jgi:di/tricarboxylate transporter